MLKDLPYSNCPPPAGLNVKISDWLIRHLLPIGWLALLTGLFWAWDRSLHHKLYYTLIAAPALLAALLQPKLLKQLLCNPLIIIFIFSAHIPH